MPQPRPEERWAAAVISAALGVRVVPHDDGSRNSMWDLTIQLTDGRHAAVEVTTATDAPSTVLWGLINPPGKRWCEPGLVGGWFLTLRPTVSAKRLRQELPGLLANFESRGLTEFSGEELERGYDLTADSLGISHGSQGGTEFPGSIYFTLALPLEQTTGFVADDGDALPTWLTQWVADPSRADNLRKLRASGADQRHLVVILRGFSGVPFGVVDLLMRDRAPVPVAAPELPNEITHIWAWSNWNTGHAFCWSNDSGWQRFSTLTHRPAD